ncbi:serine O-acetyltransferase [Shewanella algae]|uniref:serine O-acetyltransferase n=1 Tax=Shewanella algae TaxID=38313 RepID=UPI001C59B94E|nr:serine acetyltransferase [Shewanella algae]
MTRLVYFIFKIISFLHRHKIPFLPTIINKLILRVCFGLQIGNGTTIGKGVVFGYGGLGIVIHDRVILEDGVQIGSGVTIGGTNKKFEVPRVGKDTIISTGAKILGPIVVGKGCVIGANAVVLKNVPDYSVVVGVPGRVIKRDIDITKY